MFHNSLASKAACFSAPKTSISKWEPARSACKVKVIMDRVNVNNRLVNKILRALVPNEELNRGAMNAHIDERAKWRFHTGMAVHHWLENLSSVVLQQRLPQGQAT
jgi:hypothetical protein